MLTTIREKTQGWIAGIILGLITIPFALWGINSYFSSDSKIKIADVDGVDIGADAYKAALEQQRRMIQQYVGRNIDPRIFDSSEFKQQVLNSLIDNLLVNRDADKQGYRISDAQLGQLIQTMPEFQQDNRFDPRLYESALRNAGLSVIRFEKTKRETSLIQQIRSGFSRSAIITPSDISTLLRLEAQKREIAYVTITPQKFINKLTVPQDTIETYYSTHTDQFKLPEQVRIEYIRLSVEDLTKKVAISDEELRKAYAEENSRFVTPEERKASHILIELPANAGPEESKRALGKIQEMEKKIKSGEDFAALARKYSNDAGSAAKGGDLGYMRRGTLEKEFESVLFGMKSGEVSRPVKTQYGYHLIKLAGIKPEIRAPFNRVRSELETLLRKHKGEEQLYELSQKLQNLVYEHPESLAPAAEALGLQILQSDWFSSAGGKGIAAEPKVVEAAFTPEVLAQGHNSDSIETGTNAFVAARVLAHREATTRPLSQVRAEIEQIVKSQLAQEEAEKFGVKMLEQLKQGGTFAALARSQGLQLVVPKPISRRDHPGVDNRIVEVVFKAPRKAADKPVYDGLQLGKEGYAIFVLKRVEDGNAADAVKNQAKQALETRRGQEYYTAYLAGLRKRASVKIYPDRL